MFRKRIVSLILLLLCVSMLSGCFLLPWNMFIPSKNDDVSSKNDDVPASEQFFEMEDDAIDYVEDVTIPAEIDYGYLPAEWSDEPFKRNGCTSYPLVLDTALQQCRGFTVDYQVSDVDGRMKADSKFQIFYRTADGTWVKGKEFYLEDWSASVEQSISKPVTVTEVVVLCLNAGNFSWSISMGVRNPVY
ncbi:MAG: hypothetical protein U0N82_06360 [Oscillospiraceae bacterium]